MPDQYSPDAYLPSNIPPADHHHPKKLFRFDPTFNSGHAAQIIVIICSVATVYTSIRTDQVQQRADLEALKAAAVNERVATKEALTDLKVDVKDLAKTTGDIKESLAILRGQGRPNERAPEEPRK